MNEVVYFGKVKNFFRNKIRLDNSRYFEIIENFVKNIYLIMIS